MVQQLALLWTAANAFLILAFFVQSAVTSTPTTLTRPPPPAPAQPAPAVSFFGWLVGTATSAALVVRYLTCGLIGRF